MITRYLIPLLLVIAASGLIVYAFDEQYAVAKANLVKEEKLDKDIADAKLVESKRVELINRYAEVPAVADAKLQVLMPDTLHPVRLFMDISNISSRHGLELKGLSAQQGDNDPKAMNSDLGSYNVAFTVTASYGKFKEFIADLERSLQLRELSAVTFAAKAIEGQRYGATSLYVFDVNVATYSLQKKAI